VLYVDSSVLVKRYIREIGTDALNLKMQRALRADVPVLTSVLTYAEIHATLARRLKEQLLRVAEYHAATKRFDSDWRTYLSRVDLLQVVLDLVPELVKKYPLKGADAIHLASAQWATYAVQTGKATRPSNEVVFATTHKQLAEAAKAEMFETFNPQMRRLP
jgi:predicted nucleic acid-binding protein